MTAFDPLKAVHEQLVAISDVLAALRSRENAAEQAMAMAESELNAIRKLRGFALDQQAGLRERLRRLEQELKLQKS